MSQGIPDRLLVDTVTIQKPIQSFVGATKRPVFEYQTVGTGVKARFNPASTALNRNVLGQTPKKIFTVFLNVTDLKENDKIIRENDNEEFIVTEVKNFFEHHIEVVAEERK